MRPETLYLADIIEAAEAVAEFVKGFDESDFTQDAKTQSAVIQKLIVIGEAAARLPQDFKDRYPQIEWRDVIAFRNILIHAYFSIKLTIIWHTVQHDVPLLRQKIIEIIEQEIKEK
jgi:uncharacterized protein with HEPN domain